MHLNIYLLFETDKKKKKTLIELPLVYLFAPFEHTPQIKRQRPKSTWALGEVTASPHRKNGALFGHSLD